ncbi:MAG: ferredoxin reductase family protein [Ferrimicrobium sp.]
MIDGTFSEIKTHGGVALFVGSITGLIGTYLALVMIVLASRLPALERSIGHVAVMSWHRKLAPWPITLILAHAVLTTLGYAYAAKKGFVAELGVVVRTFPDMLTATIALVIMVGIGLISFKQLRTRIPREQWWLLHLLLYASIILAFAHELVLGPSFVQHPLVQTIWIGAWLAAAASILIYRVSIPLFRSLNHQLRIVEVRYEAPDVVSLILTGRRLDRLGLEGGQFFEWRFLARGLWWQAHPFTVSALPRPPLMRLTVKNVGDFSGGIASIPVGTRVAVEGPYGVFTKSARTHRLTLIIAGGIGVTAARALLEDLPADARPIVILRASREDDLIFATEIDKLAHRRHGVVYRVVGSRAAIDLADVMRLVPDIQVRDVFVCGSEGFVDSAVDAVSAAGVTIDHIHHEAYSF